jgi:D-alanine transaminase
MTGHEERDMTVYLNGVYLDRAQATVSVDDRGFLFGDGVYEVTRARDGQLFEGERHLRRLARGLDGIGLALPSGLAAAPLGISERLLRENDLLEGDATVYLQITRGTAPRTHHFPPPGTAATVFLSASRLKVAEDVRARGASVITTPELRWARCDLKTVNLLPNVLAKQQAVTAGAFEAVFVRDGLMIEGASSNTFAVVGGVLRTHPATHRILAGITREVVLELAAELGIPAAEQAVTLNELAGASEVMVTATTADVMPVVRVDGRVVGDGRPGPIARELHRALVARMERRTARAAR